MAKTISQTTWMVIAISCVLFGFAFGYVVATAPRSSGAAASSAPGPGPSDASPTLVDEQQLRTYRDILTRDPKNLQAAIRLGNLLYDAGRYAEAIGPYQQAFSLDPKNVSVSTDLGTALWYSGRPDEALAQYDKSLAIDPGHAQTLFNIGVVKRDGKQDVKGAIAAWERLLSANPGYAERPKVEQALADARQSVARAGIADLRPDDVKPSR